MEYRSALCRVALQRRRSHQFRWRAGSSLCQAKTILDKHPFATYKRNL